MTKGKASGSNPDLYQQWTSLWRGIVSASTHGLISTHRNDRVSVFRVLFRTYQQATGVGVSLRVGGAKCGLPLVCEGMAARRSALCPPSVEFTGKTIHFQFLKACAKEPVDGTNLLRRLSSSASVRGGSHSERAVPGRGLITPTRHPTRFPSAGPALLGSQAT